jgi:hypothetical protein
LAGRRHYGKGIFLFIHIEDLRRKTMSRKFIAAAVAVAFVLILVPRPSQAAPRVWTSLSAPAVFEKIERWWNLVLTDAEPPSSGDRVPAGQKNGCGMDPNGQVTCDPGGGTNHATEPSSTGSGAD